MRMLLIYTGPSQCECYSLTLSRIAALAASDRGPRGYRLASGWLLALPSAPFRCQPSRTICALTHIRNRTRTCILNENVPHMRTVRITPLWTLLTQVRAATTLRPVSAPADPEDSQMAKTNQNVRQYTLADATKLINSNQSAQQTLNAIMAQADGAALIAEACTMARAKSSTWSEAVIRAQLYRVPVALKAPRWGIKWDKDAKVFRVGPSATRSARPPKSAEESLRRLCEDLGIALFVKLTEKIAKEAIAKASAKGTSAAA